MSDPQAKAGFYNDVAKKLLEFEEELERDVYVDAVSETYNIPKESLKMIWDRFYKTDLSRGKDKKGTGLGLSIAKLIVLKHVGTIRVKSQYTRGTCFSIILPLRTY